MTKCHVLSIQVQRLTQRYKELTSVGMLASIGHTEYALFIVGGMEILIWKGLCAIVGCWGGMASRAVKVCKVSSLNHEAG